MVADVSPVLAVMPMLLGLDWMDPDWLLSQFGREFFWICLVFLFIECGLLFPFLPGDTLLFAVGLFVATGKIDIVPGGTVVELLFALTLMVAAAFAGNVSGYEIGRGVGPPLYERDGRIIKRKHFDLTREFFDRHGPIALVLGRFFAFVRTYITVVAGATRMPRERFLVWSFVGALLWVLSITMLGYWLGTAVPSLGDNLELAMIAIMIFFTIPMVWEVVRRRRRQEEVAD